MNLGLPVGPVAIGGGVMLALIASLSGVILVQHDKLVTWRLKDKDQRAVISHLGRDVADRDRRILETASREYGDAGQTAQACAATISTAYQRGVAFGRVISHAKSPTPAASGGQPGADVVLDYRQAWEASAYKPAAR